MFSHSVSVFKEIPFFHFGTDYDDTINHRIILYRSNQHSVSIFTITTSSATGSIYLLNF